MSERVGWIGVGKMGLPMASHLLRAGHQVIAFDSVEGHLAALEARGARKGESVAAVAREASVVFSSVPDDNAFRAVALGSEGVIASAAPGSVFVDTSTVSAEISAEAARVAADAGVGYLRATVSGNNHFAEAAMLTVMASGSRADFERVLPLLAHFGSHQHYVGDAEQARTLKLVINLMVAGTAALLAEALTLGQRGGVEWGTMLTMLADSAVASPIVKSKALQLMARDYSATFTTQQLGKDLDLILQTGKALGAFMPLTALAAQNNAAVVASGMGGEDYIAIVKLVEKLSGIDAPTFELTERNKG